MDLTIHTGLLVVLLVCAIYGIVTRDWRANFGALAIALFLSILLVVRR